MADIYDIGDVVRVTGTFRDTATNAYADPTTEVTVYVEDPSGNVATNVYNGGAGTVVKHSAGRYYYDIAIDEAGAWHARIVGTGTYGAGAQLSFKVRTAVAVPA